MIERGLIRGEPTEPTTWRGLDLVLDKTYGRKKIARTFIDSGFSTAAVYEYCRRGNGCYPIKGVGGFGKPLIYRYAYPKNKGVTLTLLGVDDGKTEIFSRLNVTEGTGRIHFNYNFDDTFLSSC